MNFMAIIRDLSVEELPKVESIIYDVILNRKYKFDLEIILDDLKGEIVKKGYDLGIMDCSCFHLLLHEALEKLSSNEGPLYKEDQDKYYYPEDYIILNDYRTNWGDLFYLVREDNNYYFKNVSNGDKTNRVKRYDFVLCGGLSKDKRAVQSDISFEEIYLLFHDFINEGASKEEAINHILNFYKVNRLDGRYSCANDFQISRSVRSKKLVLKKNKIDD